MPNIVAIKCPSCAGDIELDSEREFGFCVFCGTRIFIPNAVQRIKGTVSIDNSPVLSSHLVLADRAISVGNFAEAAIHYEQCLVIDPDNASANLGKGICALGIMVPYSCELRHLKAYGPAAFSKLISDGGYRAIVNTVALIDNAMRAALMNDFAAQCQTAHRMAKNMNEVNAANRESSMLSKMLDEAVSAVRPILHSIGLENATAPLVSNAWRSFCSNMREMGKYLKTCGVVNAQTKIDELLSVLPTADALTQQYDIKLANEYWSHNIDEYNILQQRRQRLEKALSSCGLLDLSRKKQIKNKIAELDSAMRYPQSRKFYN